MEERTRFPARGRPGQDHGGPRRGGPPWWWAPGHDWHGAGADPGLDEPVGPGQSWIDRWDARRSGTGRFRRGPKGSGPIRRSMDHPMLGGVAEGISARTGIDVTLIRIAFVLTALGAFGAAAYVLAWLLIPVSGENTGIASKALADRRGLALAAGLGSLLVVVLATASALGASWVGTLATPLVITAVGMVLVVRNATGPEQDRIRQLTDALASLTESHERSRIVLRVLVGAVLLGGGITLILLAGHSAGELLQPLGGALLVLAALVVVLGPWWLRIARDLLVERQARVRAEERADMAARVHDSVLQTLALIQRRSGDPQQVIQLARAQERELRSWLFDGRAPGSMDELGMTFAGGVRLIEQEVESRHGVPVDAVIVGDCELDDDLRALLAAGREATVNAVKWSGADVVSIFAEVEADEVSLYVRDRGKGFDPAVVPGDRQGLAESIRGRMARRGGAAVIRSAPGEGTEVSLTMPRVAGKREPGPA
jgi:signal transduction histidine kinase